MYVCMQSFVQFCAGIAPGPDPPNQQGNRVLEAGQQGNLPRVPRTVDRRSKSGPPQPVGV